MRRTTLLGLCSVLLFTLAACDPAQPSGGSTTTAAPPALTPPAPSQITPLSPSAAADRPVQPAQPAAEAEPEVIAAQHLLVAYKGAKGAAKAITRSKADAKKRAEEALEKARKGEDFSALVKRYSDEPGAADRQGNLGKFKRDAMVKPFADAAFKLKVNDISDVVETDFGYHVIKRNQ